MTVTVTGDSVSVVTVTVVTVTIVTVSVVTVTVVTLIVVAVTVVTVIVVTVITPGQMALVFLLSHLLFLPGSIVLVRSSRL